MAAFSKTSVKDALLPPECQAGDLEVPQPISIGASTCRPVIDPLRVHARRGPIPRLQGSVNCAENFEGDGGLSTELSVHLQRSAQLILETHFQATGSLGQWEYGNFKVYVHYASWHKLNRVKTRERAPRAIYISVRSNRNATHDHRLPSVRLGQTRHQPKSIEISQRACLVWWWQ